MRSIIIQACGNEDREYSFLRFFFFFFAICLNLSDTRANVRVPNRGFAGASRLHWLGVDCLSSPSNLSLPNILMWTVSLLSQNQRGKYSYLSKKKKKGRKKENQIRLPKFEKKNSHNRNIYIPIVSIIENNSCYSTIMQNNCNQVLWPWKLWGHERDRVFGKIKTSSVQKIFSIHTWH